MRVDVLHVVEAFGGGVEVAIASYVDDSPDICHVRDSVETPN